MSRRDDNFELFLPLIGFAVVVLIALGIGLAKASTSHTEVLQIRDKQRVCDGGSNGSCRYLIWTDQGVHENTDSMLAGKWDSSDVQGALQIGRTYEVDVRGWRIPFLSSYPNITAVRREVTP
ncbi:hypothetical protein ACWDTT_36320 [Streptosporangium sandarakinum]